MADAKNSEISGTARQTNIGKELRYMIREKFFIPELDGEYVHVYQPTPDLYQGENTPSFTKGTRYDEWITNDFSVLHDNGVWHMVGITHPRPRGFVNDFDYDEADVHEAEYQLFHCTATADSFSKIFHEGSFRDCDKILYPSERPGEKPEIWAPHLMKHAGAFQVIYSPQEMRRAETADFKTWKRKAPLFACRDFGARDPFLYCEDGVYYILYTESRLLKYRTSEDAEHWSDEKILQTSLFAECENESPFLMKKDGVYYLFWTICDGRNGCYDNRTMVYASRTIEGLYRTAPITMLKAHAPEIIKDRDGCYYLLSAFYPNNGVSAVKLKWV